MAAPRNEALALTGNHTIIPRAVQDRFSPKAPPLPCVSVIGMGLSAPNTPGCPMVEIVPPSLVTVLKYN